MLGSVESYPDFASAPLDACDVLYVTRLQKERFADAAEFARVQASYQVSKATLTRAQPDAIVLHPLPRVDELDYALDGDPRAAYFRQAAYGVPVRMALIAAVLGLRQIPVDPPVEVWTPDDAPFACPNPRCITHAEPGIPRRAETREGVHRCAYCEAKEEAACPVC